MKLAKVTRKRLYAAEGKVIAITWPESAPRAVSGRRYPVYGSGGKLFDIHVERVKNGATIKAWVRMDADPFRPMVGIQGIRNENGDYESEPERVSVEFERELAFRAMPASALLTAERRHESALDGKERKIGSSPRAERAIARQKRSMERRKA